MKISFAVQNVAYSNINHQRNRYVCNVAPMTDAHSLTTIHQITPSTTATIVISFSNFKGIIVGTWYPCHTRSWRRPKKKIERKIIDVSMKLHLFYCWISCLTCLNLFGLLDDCILRLSHIHPFIHESVRNWLFLCVYANIHFSSSFVGSIRSGFNSHMPTILSHSVRSVWDESWFEVWIPFEYYNQIHEYFRKAIRFHYLFYRMGFFFLIFDLSVCKRKNIYFKLRSIALQQ